MTDSRTSGFLSSCGRSEAAVVAAENTRDPQVAQESEEDDSFETVEKCMRSYDFLIKKLLVNGRL